VVVHLPVKQTWVGSSPTSPAVRSSIEKEKAMPVKKRQVENVVTEEIEVQPSAEMLDDIVKFYHETMKNDTVAIEQRIRAAQELANLGKYGFNVDPMFASSTMYVSN
jgi:hypothetical protein